MAQKTALEWFTERLKQINGEDNPWFDIPLSLLEKAKAMEKHQIEQAFRIGEMNNDAHHYTGKKIHQDETDYYNQAYNNKNK